MYGKPFIGNIKVNFYFIIIEENPFVVRIMSVFTEECEGYDVFKQHSLSVKKEQIEHTIVYKIVFTRSFFFSERCRNISQA